MASDPDVPSHQQSEQELEDKDAESPDEGDGGDHVYQTLDGPERSLVREPVYALPHKAPQVRLDWQVLHGLLVIKGRACHLFVSASRPAVSSQSRCLAEEGLLQVLH